MEFFGGMLLGAVLTLVGSAIYSVLLIKRANERSQQSVPVAQAEDCVYFYSGAQLMRGYKADENNIDMSSVRPVNMEEEPFERLGEISKAIEILRGN